jgi:class 3 adenylate cyclase/tetratricopeptide (TPR) repeat protein
MQCPACNHENPAQHRFCGQCGAPLPAACPHCGAVARPGERFCGQCGRRLAAEAGAAGAPPAPRAAPPAANGERRLATVLFADLSGYTVLGERLDPEEVQAIMGRIKGEAVRIVEGQGGIVNQFVGDEVLALFGIPSAHEDDPRRAVAAALELHELVRGVSGELELTIGQALRLHTGINTGLVVTHAQDGREGRFGLTGDTVNTGARLMSHAQRDQILLSPATQRLVSEHYETEAQAAVALKGKALPVVPYRVLGPALHRARPLAPLVGRARELAQFRAVLESSLAGGRGHALLLRGEAGIGKSRLVAELRAMAQGLGYAAHSALVLDFGGGRTRDVSRGLVHSLLDLSAQAEPALREAAVRQALEAGLVEPDGEAFLHDLLELELPQALRSFYSALSAERRVEGLRTTVAALVRSLSAHAPLLLSVEDLHWADAGTLALLGVLAREVAGLPAVLAMTTRPDGDPLDAAWRAAHGQPAITTVELAPLPEAEAARLAEAYPELAPAMLRNCLERAAGNPLFLEQLLLNAEETATEQLPVSVQTLVQARMDRLPARDRMALQAASVLGQRFTLEALRHLLGDEAFGPEALVAHHLLRGEGEDCVFGHALIRDGVYESVLRSRRRELHGRAAAWFAAHDPDLHAEHLERAEDPAAAQAYLEAARGHAARYRFERALARVQRGVALGREGPLGSELLAAEGRILQDLGRFGDSLPAFEAALAAAGNDAERCRARLGMANGMRVVDRLEEAMQVLDAAQAEAERAGLLEEQARLHHLRGNLYFPQARAKECLAEHGRALELARQAGSVELEVRAHGGLGDAYFLVRDPERASEHFAQCVELARRHGFGRVEVANKAMLVACRMFVDGQRVLLAESRANAELALRLGDLRTAMLSFLQAGMAALEAMEWDEGTRLVERSRELARTLGARRFEPELLGFLARVTYLRGERERALPMSREAVALARATSLSYTGPQVLGTLAMVTPDAEERRRAMEEAEALIEGGCHMLNVYCYCVDAADSALEHGEWDLVDHVADVFERTFPPGLGSAYSFFSRRARALAQFGRGQRDEALRTELEQLLAWARERYFGLPARRVERALAEGWPAGSAA